MLLINDFIFLCGFGKVKIKTCLFSLVLSKDTSIFDFFSKWTLARLIAKVKVIVKVVSINFRVWQNIHWYDVPWICFTFLCNLA